MNMREEFEKWFKEKFEVPDFVFSDFDESAGEYNYTDETEELYINITMMLEAWQAAHPKWIKCSEQMPEEFGRYWCYVEEQNSLGKSNYQWNCSWNGDVWSDKALTGRVTHWMPLPNPPEE